MPRAMPSDYEAYFATQIEPGDYGMPRPLPADYSARKTTLTTIGGWPAAATSRMAHRLARIPAARSVFPAKSALLPSDFESACEVRLPGAIAAVHAESTDARLVMPVAWGSAEGSFVRSRLLEPPKQGIAVWGAIFVRRGDDEVSEAAAGTAAASGDRPRELVEAASSGYLDQVLATLPPKSQQVAANAAGEGFLAGLNDVLTLGALLSFAGAVLALWLVREYEIEREPLDDQIELVRPPDRELAAK